jgi:hypothetical protein
LSENTKEKQQAKFRIERVFRFLQEMYKLRTPPKQDLNDYDWKLSIGDLPKHPTIEIGEAPKDDESDDNLDIFLLRVTRPTETHCPEPPTEINGWIQSNWKSLDSNVEPLISRNFNDENGKTRTEQFDSEKSRVKLFADWKIKRDKWIEAEAPVRAAGAVYSNLYKLLGQIERESEKFQLYLGDGILRWKAANGDISHPLVLLRVNIEFDSNIPQFFRSNISA